MMRVRNLPLGALALALAAGALYRYDPTLLDRLLPDAPKATAPAAAAPAPAADPGRAGWSRW